MISSVLLSLFTISALSDSNRDLLHSSEEDSGSDYNYFAIEPYIAQPGQLFNFRDAFINNLLPFITEADGYKNLKIGFDIGSNTFTAFYEFESQYQFMHMANNLPFTPDILQLLKEKKEASSIDLFRLQQKKKKRRKRIRPKKGKDGRRSFGDKLKYRVHQSFFYNLHDAKKNNPHRESHSKEDM